MSKHTPGPWHVVNEDGKPVVKSLDDFYITNTIDAAGYDSNDDTMFANARLMAAAPDLLEALNAAEDLLHRMGMQSSDAYQEINAAIAKATGETK